MTQRTDVLPPPVLRIGPLRWLKENLFSSWYNTLLTLAALALLYVAVRGFLSWAFTEARWSVIPANLELLLIGTFPRDQTWRVWLCIYVVALLAGWSGGLWGGLIRQLASMLGAAGLFFALLPFESSTRLWVLGIVVLIVAFSVLGLLGRGQKLFKRAALVGWLLSFPIIILLLHGFKGSAVLPLVEPHQWSGLLLTFLLAIVGIVASFPLGVLLALGRRSDLPAVRLFCIFYIEVIRGVPLITILFMAQVMLPLLLPSGLRIENVIRAMIGLTLFTAAYMAENVRGGLQAVPLGQIEAAKALGLSSALTTLLIVLPQALRAVIPAIVGQFISLFKDTSLVAVVGLLDLLNIALSVLANPAWLGLALEVFLFVALIYGVFSYTMSYASRRIEVALGLGQR